MEEFEHRDLTQKIIGCCYNVHNQIGPGFPEKIYTNALKIKLKQIELNFNAEKEFKVIFEDVVIGTFRCDLVIENKIIVELKAVTGFQPKLFKSQVISYLKASNLKIGLLINFGNDSCEVNRFVV